MSMQIYKDGALLYDPIDNTGSSDLAALGARTTIGRLDTLDGRFAGYYTKTEVLDLLTGMASTYIVATLPVEPDANTYYMVGDDTNGYVLHYYDNDLEHAIVGSYELDISAAIPQREELPAASADYSGKVWQYTGTNQAQYVRGKWYACVNQSYYGWLNTATATTAYTVTATPTAGAYLYNGSGVRLSVNVASVSGTSMTDTNGATYTRNADADKAIWQWSDLAGGAASSVWGDDLTPSKALTSDASGKIVASTTTADELARLGGVTANVQEQIDGLRLGGHLYKFTEGYVDSEACVFDFTDSGSTSTDLRVAEKRIFVARMTNPLTSSNITGYVETTQLLVPSGPTIYIEQRFYNEQNGNRNNRIEFARKGSVTLSSLQDYKNWVATKQASITWNAWVPIEYPYDTIAVNTSVIGGTLQTVISGGQYIINLNNMVIKTAPGTSNIVIGTVASGLKELVKPNSTSCYYRGFATTALATTIHTGLVQYKAATGQIELYGNFAVNESVWGSITIPLGY